MFRMAEATNVLKLAYMQQALLFGGAIGLSWLSSKYTDPISPPPVSHAPAEALRASSKLPTLKMHEVRAEALQSLAEQAPKKNQVLREVLTELAESEKSEALRNQAGSPTKDINEGYSHLWSDEPKKALLFFKSAEDKCPNAACRENVELLQEVANRCINRGSS